MKKNLYLRTDVLPEEIPILFSNKHLYYYFNSDKIKNNFEEEIFNESIPYYYLIPKNKETKRNIGLLHPIAQLQSFYYILKYDNMIVNFCKNSPYSVRSPVKINIPKIEKKEYTEKKLKKVNEDYNLTNTNEITTEEINNYYNKYFSYNKFTTISSLYNSPEFIRDKLSYDYFLIVDIQNFFPSIYTHSLSWAIYGNKSLGKEYRTENTFANITDKINQKINFNETNGLIVGPEFSRVIAELLLTRIDLNINYELNKRQLYKNYDYQIYRYVDDYFIFANQLEVIKTIESELEKKFQEYNLLQNISKREIQTKPITIGSTAITKLKNHLNDFEVKRSLFYLELREKYFDELKRENTLGKVHYWRTLYENTKDLIIDNPEDNAKLVKYFLRTITSKIPKEFNISYKTKITLKEIIEIISNIYVFAITPNNTNYLLQSYIKILGFINKNKNIDINLKEEITDYIFQRLFYVLKINFDQFNSTYDILVFMKVLNNKIPSYFLTKILEFNKENYFIMCSVAKYILDEENKEVEKGFKTVKKKLVKIIESYFESYKSKGLIHKVYDAEYYYLLNDFSKYPGFSNNFKSELRHRLRTEINKVPESDRNIFREMSRYSFYNWTDNTDTFIKKLIKKSSYTISKTNEEY